MSLSDASGLCLLAENSAKKLLVDSSEMSVCMCNGAADETDAADGGASCLASDTMRFFSSCVSVTYGVKKTSLALAVYEIYSEHRRIESYSQYSGIALRSAIVGYLIAKFRP